MNHSTLTLTTPELYNKATPTARSKALDNQTLLNQFLQSVERKAYHMALFATQNPDDALEIVQEAMTKLVEKYAQRDAAQWRPLFYRILNSRIHDFYRKQTVRRRWLAWWPTSSKANSADGDTTNTDLIDNAADLNLRSPEAQHQLDTATKALVEQLQRLSERQRQAFLLRAWEGLSVAETAMSMKCSEGSVKTHYSRAIHTLREFLGEHPDDATD
ncbi:MAG: RNA polymerase sigma factor [Gammaproteobacteria bacterium]|nr:RNA polymerase sigma factor [Gammaproteobacteria bacterium]NVK88219.1 RNA polymerase sigma factor [Gammaproteobacteria bacterium]